MKSIRLKLVFMYVAVILIVMIISGTFNILTIKNNEESKAESRLIDYAQKINDYLERNLDENGELISLDEKDFSLMLNNLNYEGNIINSNGTTIKTTVLNYGEDLPTYTQSVVTSALQGNPKFQVGRKYPNAALKETIWIEYARPVFDKKDNVKFVIYVRMDAEDIYEDIARTTNTIVLSVIIAMILTAIIGVIFSSTLTKPIIKITAKAKELAAGHLNQNITVESNDEIGELTESFNFMASELSKTMEIMENEKNKMEIVLYNMTDGVLAYDNNGKLIHANQVSKELLEFINIDNYSFQEFMEQLNVFDMVNGLPLEDNYKEITIAIKDKFINATFNSYKKKDGNVEGIVIVLQDITKHKKLDNMRKEFVANVSHEIRTPLTTIKSYTETLIDGAIDDKTIATEFLDIINSETDRMTFIVKDLLELSSIDNNQLVFNTSVTDLRVLIKQAIKQHKLTAEKGGKSIKFEEPTSEIKVNVDSSRIIQVLGNIISNSLKYSAENAVINIYIEESLDNYRLYIRDNGFGIPKEDLRRIFERFYRVDKARSRAMGGTGLGLSIAKEIMESHGGQISVTSELNKGTTMILRFPKIKKSK